MTTHDSITTPALHCKSLTRLKGRNQHRVSTKSGKTNFQEISSIHFYKKNPQDFLCDKPYNTKIQKKFVMSINEHVMMSSNAHHCAIQQYSVLKIVWHAKFTLLNYKNFPRASTKFQEISNISRIPGAISNSRFPGAADILQQQASWECLCLNMHRCM